MASCGDQFHPLFVQEQQLGAFGDADADGSPRYDEQTQAIVERGLHLGSKTVLSCTVLEGRPMYLTRAEVPIGPGILSLRQIPMHAMVDHDCHPGPGLDPDADRDPDNFIVTLPSFGPI